ncbi:hypothetical protein RRG08_008090 [Elysia crispata]|uniref:Uncharacterized protein n=1 Tax=Elysia crispata TaxID=231223 RepID=A0AAE1CVR2_9GAST|nr:hypothetical protein RRG08_008090 [Elysia crispata]
MRSATRCCCQGLRSGITHGQEEKDDRGVTHDGLVLVHILVRSPDRAMGGIFSSRGCYDIPPYSRLHTQSRRAKRPSQVGWEDTALCTHSQCQSLAVVFVVLIVTGVVTLAPTSRGWCHYIAFMLYFSLPGAPVCVRKLMHSW